MKINKIVLIHFIILIGIMGISNNSYASLKESALNEAEGRTVTVTVPDTPSDDTSNNSDATPTTSEESWSEPTINITINTSIQGTVWEDMESIYLTSSDDSLANITVTGRNKAKDDDESGVSGVKISLDGSSSSSRITDSDGTFEFENPSPGIYGITAIYGNNSSPSVLDDSLKYNAQDYSIEIDGSGGFSLYEQYVERIKSVSSSFTEVYILIDYSYTMRNNDNERLNVVKESAEKFVTQLFNETEGNIAVGFIAFAYDACVVVSPSETKSDVINAIESFDIEEGYVTSDPTIIAHMYSSLNSHGGTDFSYAYKKAASSFISDESNKFIISFSDGTATAYHSIEGNDSDAIILYTDDFDDDTWYNKLLEVNEKTKETIQEIVSQGIELVTVFNYLDGEDDADEKEFVEDIYTTGLGNKFDEWFHYVSMDSLDDVKEALIELTLPQIIESQTEYTNYDSASYYDYGDEDATQRDKINNYFSNFSYENLKVFELVNAINNGESYNKSDYNSEISNLLSEYYGKSATIGDYIIDAVYYNDEGKPTSIIHGDEVLYTFSYYEDWPKNSDGEKEIQYKNVTTTVRDDDGNIVYEDDGVTPKTETTKVKDQTKKVKYVKINGTEYLDDNTHVSITEVPIVVNIRLYKRDTYKMEIDNNVTAVKLTLSTGTILFDRESSNAYLTTTKSSEIKEIYCKQLEGIFDAIDSGTYLDIERISDLNTLWYDIDTTIAQGATLEIEYTITINNSSENSAFSESFSLVDYFDYDVYYNSESKLLTEDRVNSDYGWQEVKRDDIGNLISDEVYEANENKTILYVSYTKETYNEFEKIYDNSGNITTDYTLYSGYVNPVIGNNGKRYIKLVVSKILSSELDQLIHCNQVEIAEYSNTIYRRMNYTESNVTGTGLNYYYPISGNYIPQEVTVSSIAGVEIDDAVSQKVQIIPPTGSDSIIITNITKETIISKELIICISILTSVILIICIRKFLKHRKV